MITLPNSIPPGQPTHAGLSPQRILLVILKRTCFCLTLLILFPISILVVFLPYYFITYTLNVEKKYIYRNM